MSARPPIIPRLTPPEKRRPPRSVISAFVAEGYLKETLVTLYQAYLQPLFEQRRGFGHHALPRNASKARLVEVVTDLFMDEALFLSFFEGLPLAGREAIRRVAWFGPHSVRQLAKLLQVQMIEPKPTQRSYYTPAVLAAPFCILMNDLGPYDHSSARQLWQSTLYWPLPLRGLVQSYLPTPALLLVEDGEPDTAFYYTLDADQPARLMRCAHFLSEGHMVYTKVGKPQRAAVKKMQTYCEIPEFFPETKGPYAFQATETLIDWLGDRHPPADADEMELLRDLLLLFTEPDLDESLTMSYLRHLKRADLFFDAERDQTARVVLLGLLSVLPVGAWVSVDALLRFIAYHTLPVSPLALHDTRRALQVYGVKRDYPLPAPFTDQYYYYDQGYMTADLYPPMVTRPLVQGFLAHMAVLGVVDLAYDYPTNDVATVSSKPYLSVFDGVRYVRMNALGAYLAGHTATYTQAASADRPETKVLLNPDYLILTLEGDDKIKEMIAEEVGTRLSPGRYRVDYSSFLRGCDSRSDVQNKVERFHRHLADEVPEGWASFFREVVRKVHPLREQPAVRVYRLDGDAELIHLFARDPVLQKYARKAEGHHVLIEESALSRVRKRLEQFGYLMPR